MIVDWLVSMTFYFKNCLMLYSCKKITYVFNKLIGTLLFVSENIHVNVVSSDYGTPIVSEKYYLLHMSQSFQYIYF